MSFYRVYRPQTIDEVDNLSVKQHLKNLVSKDKNKLPHAYIFNGPKGTGKTTVARLIAKLYNCKKPGKQGPCGKCDNCLSIANGSYLDVLEIDAASNRGIDEIRLLKERIGLSPTIGSHTIYIIDEVHMLTSEAFNALLKTLEEPPKHAVFILATTNIQKVPQTIISRCLQIIFSKAQASEIVSSLRRVIKAEKINIDDNAVSAIAGVSDGSFRDAVKVLEQLSLTNKKITQDLVYSYLSKPQPQIVKTFITNVINKDIDKSFDIICDIDEQGIDIKLFITDCLELLEKSLIEKIKTDKYSDDSKSFVNNTNLLIKLFIKAYADTKYSPVTSLPIKSAVIDFYQVINRKDDEDDQDHNAALEINVTRETGTDKKESFQSKKSTDLVSIEKLTDCWKDLIEEIKPHNHSVAGVLRSSRPKEIINEKLIIEAYYAFHQEKLSEQKTKQIISKIIKKLFGKTMTIEVVIGSKN